MELKPVDRLKIHLLLHYPRLKMKHVQLSDRPGFLQAPSGLIDIRGASYAAGTPPLRLWNELHSHFAHHVEVIKRKNNIPTRIAWNGMIYHLDQSKSFRRNAPKKRIRINSSKEVSKSV